MSRIALVLAVFLLVLAAPAAAKELSRVTICGAEGCTDVTGEATHAVVDHGIPTGETARPSEPHFRVRIAIGDGRRIFERFGFRWFRDRQLLLDDQGTWMRVSKATQDELELLSAGVKPYGATARPATSDESGDGAPSALAIVAPTAVVAIGGAVLLTRRRRRR